jgi:hypothetical protein
MDTAFSKAKRKLAFRKYLKKRILRCITLKKPTRIQNGSQFPLKSARAIS